MTIYNKLSDQTLYESNQKIGSAWEEVNMDKARARALEEGPDPYLHTRVNLLVGTAIVVELAALRSTISGIGGLGQIHSALAGLATVIGKQLFQMQQRPKRRWWG